MDKIISILGNLNGGPKTTIVGAAFMLFGGYLIYSSEQELTWVSIEVGMIGIGLFLLFTPDRKET